MVCLPAAAIVGPDRASDRLLDEIERRACRYFYEMADPNTGLVRDRATANEPYAPGAASIAATGFGLSALAIGATRRYLDPGAAGARVRKTLQFLCESAPQEHGFFYHFMDSDTGRRIWKSEVSSIDTGWLLCGVLHSSAAWDDAEIRKLARELLDRADWEWMLNGSPALCHGWTPETGFLQYRWDSYSEGLAMYLLAIASGTHPIPASSWNAFKRPMRDFEGIFFIDAGAPLFVHQYSHAWFDFRARRDAYANYFRNSVRATQAHKLFCLSYARDFPGIRRRCGGVTASDSRTGYRVWSLAQQSAGRHAGAVRRRRVAGVPAATSVGRCCRTCSTGMATRSWTKYGFVDAFHPGQQWYDRYVLGIDQGIMLLMAENLRGGSVWTSVMSTPQARRAFEAVGLRQYGEDG